MSTEQLFGALKTSMNKELIDLIRVEIREGLKHSIREEMKSELRQEMNIPSKETKGVTKAAPVMDEETKNRIREEIREEIKKKYAIELRENVKKELRDELSEEVKLSLRMELRELVKDKLREELKEEVKTEEIGRHFGVSPRTVPFLDDATPAAGESKSISDYRNSTAKASVIEKYQHIMEGLFTENGMERLQDLSDVLSTVLKRFSTERELKFSDKNSGCVNEITFKGMVLSVLNTCMEITGRNLGIWSEREVQFEDGRKGYIDLLLKQDDHFVVIESDYIPESLVSKSEDGSMTYFKRADHVDGETKLVTIEKMMWINKLMKTHAESFARGLRNLLTKKTTKKQFKFTCIVICGYGSDVHTKVSVSVNSSRSGTATPTTSRSPRPGSPINSATHTPRASFSGKDSGN
jgi:hypothetical protein